MQASGLVLRFAQVTDFCCQTRSTFKDGTLYLCDTDGVTGDDDFIKIYPFSPYTGGCCPCPEHNPSASTTATRLSCSGNLRTWGDAAKTTQCTSVGRGDAVYVEAIGAGTNIGGDKILWQWTEDGETCIKTNTYTIFSLRMFADLNFDDTINSNDYAAASSLSLSEYGWPMLVASNVFRKVELKTDVLIPGYLILSLMGDAQVRIWTTATPTTNDTPLLITGQTVTNGVDGVNFVSYPDSMIYVEAIGAGTASLTYSYAGTDSAEGFEYQAELDITAFKVTLFSVVLDADVQHHVRAFLNSEAHSLGIICKTQLQADTLYERIRDTGENIHLLNAASTHFHGGVIVATAHLAKGLEFDQVIVPFCTQENYCTLIDRHMLYVACTRAMHRLTLTHMAQVSPLFWRSMPQQQAQADAGTASTDQREVAAQLRR